MIDVPMAKPVTLPVTSPTFTFALFLLHEPPVVGSARVIVAPMQTRDGPAIAAGSGLIVTTAVVKQPVGSV